MFRFNETQTALIRYIGRAYMAKSWASGHDGGFIDGHCVFGVIGYDSMAGLMVGCDGLILLVNVNTPPLRAWF